MIWLNEKECTHRAASLPHLTATTCREIFGYCQYRAASGFYWIRKPSPFNITRVWCNFDTHEERYTIVGDEAMLINNTIITQIPNLSKEFRLEFQLSIGTMDPEDGIGNLRDFFGVFSDDSKPLVLMQGEQSADYYTTKQHKVVTSVTKEAAGAVDAFSGNVDLQMGFSWNNFTLVKWLDDTDETYKLDAYLNGKVMNTKEKLEDCQLFENVVVKTGGATLPRTSYLRNFFIYNKFERKGSIEHSSP